MYGMEKGPPAGAPRCKEMRARLQPQRRMQVYGAAQPPRSGDHAAILMDDCIYLRVRTVPEEETQGEGPRRSTSWKEDAAGHEAASDVELPEAVSTQGWDGKPAVAGEGEGRRHSLPLVSPTNEAAVLRAAPAYEHFSFNVSLPPARFSRASAGSEDGEACVQRTRGAVLISSKLSPADPAFPSTGATLSLPPPTVSAHRGDFSTTARPLVCATRSRPASRLQSSLRGRDFSNVAQTPAGSRTSDAGLVPTINERAVALAAAAEPATAAATARGAAAAGCPVAEHAFARRRPFAAVDAPAAVSQAAVCVASGRRRVLLNPRKPTAAKRRYAAVVPQGFSLAHIPAGFLWGRPRLGALRLLHKREGNPDRLLLVGPNWNFAVAMFVLHVVGITFFLYVFLTGFKEDLWVFAGGVILCLVTFAAFLSTVFKDPGLPLKVSLVELQPQRLTPTTARLLLQKTSSRELQQRVSRVLRGASWLPKMRESYMNKPRRKPAALFAGRREIQRQTLPFTEREGDIPCRRRVSSPDDPRTAGSGAREERKGRSHSNKGSFTGSRRSSDTSSSEYSCTKDYSQDSDNSSDSDGSNDESDSSNSAEEVISITSDKTEELSDGIWAAASCTDEEDSTGKRRAQVTHDKGVPEERRAAGLLDSSAPAKRNLCAPNCGIRTPREKHQPQLGAAFATVVGKRRGDPQHVFSPRGGSAKTSAPHPLYIACENAVKLRVRSFLFTEKRQHARRGNLGRRPARFSTLGMQQRRENNTGFDTLSADVRLNGYSAVPVIQQSPCSSQAIHRRYRRRGLVRGLKFFPRKKVRGNHEGDGTNSSHSRFCVICKIAPPPGTYHCEECRVCIEGYDHHCPWTSKCIGKGNTREFYTWILFTLVTVLYFGMTTTLLRTDDDADVSGVDTRDAVHTDVKACP